MKTLEVDIGNSKMKWRLRQSSLIGENALVGPKGEISLADCMDSLSSIEEVPDKVCVSCVVPSMEAVFHEACTLLWKVAPAFAKVVRRCAGVTNGYKDVSQMGVDRWLAMIAAYTEFRSACLVIDVGTAPTLDLLLASGVHLGGYITPGFNLMREALLSKTEIRDISSSAFGLIDYDSGTVVGSSTQQAISGGLCAMQVGLIRMSIDRLIGLGAESPHLIFSGGGSEYLSQLVEASLFGSGVRQVVGSIVLRPALVLDGLSLSV